MGLAFLGRAADVAPAAHEVQGGRQALVREPLASRAGALPGNASLCQHEPGARQRVREPGLAGLGIAWELLGDNVAILEGRRMAREARQMHRAAPLDRAGCSGAKKKGE